MVVEDEDEETVQWTVMGVVSCIPLINWTVGTDMLCLRAAEFADLCTQAVLRSAFVISNTFGVAGVGVCRSEQRLASRLLRTGGAVRRAVAEGRLAVGRVHALHAACVRCAHTGTPSAAALLS